MTLTRGREIVVRQPLDRDDVVGEPGGAGSKRDVASAVVVDEDPCAVRPRSRSKPRVERRRRRRRKVDAIRRCRASPPTRTEPHQEDAGRRVVDYVRDPKRPADHRQRIATQRPRYEVRARVHLQTRHRFPRITSGQCLVSIRLAIQVVPPVRRDNFTVVRVYNISRHVPPRLVVVDRHHFGDRGKTPFYSYLLRRDGRSK